MLLCRWGGIVIVILLTIFIAACSSAAPTSSTFDPNTIALGEQVYTDNCAACHGENLEGEPNWQMPNAEGLFPAPPHDETGHTWHHGDQYLLDRIRYGTQNLDPQMQASSNMPGYADTLTESEMAAVLLYIKSSWSDEIRETQAERTAAE